MTSFDKYASEYDSWFCDNHNVLLSEASLVAEVLKDAPGPILSVGCGSGLFEIILKENFGINVTDGVEPSSGMAAIARSRGMNVTEATAEDFEYPAGKYGTILFNGSPSYINDLGKVLDKVWDALPEGGRVILIDVPKESGYGQMYNLAKALGTWDHPLLEGCYPANPYPIEFVKQANWRTTSEKLRMLENAGFCGLSAMQTLTTHPLYSNFKAEEPQEGYDKGCYVAVYATK